jgi:hypothetical protein
LNSRSIAAAGTRYEVLAPDQLILSFFSIEEPLTFSVPFTKGKYFHYHDIILNIFKATSTMA